MEVGKETLCCFKCTGRSTLPLVSFSFPLAFLP